MLGDDRGWVGRSQSVDHLQGATPLRRGAGQQRRPHRAAFSLSRASPGCTAGQRACGSSLNPGCTRTGCGITIRRRGGISRPIRWDWWMGRVSMAMRSRIRGGMWTRGGLVLLLRGGALATWSWRRERLFLRSTGVFLVWLAFWVPTYIQVGVKESIVFGLGSINSFLHGHWIAMSISAFIMWALYEASIFFLREKWAFLANFVLAVVISLFVMPGLIYKLI